MVNTACHTLVLCDCVFEASETTDLVLKANAMIEVSKCRVQCIQPLEIHYKIIKTSERYRIGSFSG